MQSVQQVAMRGAMICVEYCKRLELSTSLRHGVAALLSVARQACA